ncbi:Glycine--tRNA ligase beta subunit [Zhongshania aliphaticivorans]|uniref:Glycine--tRNA ligase beta subunit n=1 Tax=Zhongshania aliphaticivorans TaxID=1470434 RepID=A0A5S9PL60_9GAMM|nr:glycine--tRNA ligase subunit beta [Zhongshania aliphaticivorans]CAA0104464.1 Glycine--tRNA ligase beta subunit [Zhongshania aliphaticivorans]CAA0104716.1 Glycine--tRNA ligase beta subunit [Zhongshania aliphaticivorans]
MNHVRDLLIEIGTEELPPKSLKTLSNAFSESIRSQLAGLGLTFSSSKSFATPRRLAILISDLAETAADKELEIWGPPVKVAFDDAGNATNAALAFAKKNKLNIEEIHQFIANDGKQEKLCYRSIAKGVETKSIIASTIDSALNSLPIAKRMRWGSSRTEFVRPIQWLAIVFGNETIQENIFGLTSSNNTRGHRFHCTHELEILSANSYETILKEQGKVIADYQQRQDIIRNQITELGINLGGNTVISEDLLDEVNSLVEWPVSLAGSFEQRFLKVPAEALISSMKEHQKYFHIVDANNMLMPHFITVANIESHDPQKVIDGNERVIRPRLSDAAFFFETDCKTSLEQRRDKLANIVFQDKLGTIYDKTCRVAELSSNIAEHLGADATLVKRAAELSKSDLVTDMVLEFDDMQGIAGYYYAQNDGEENEVALTMNEQYMPRFAGDTLPTTMTGTIVALADRLDTITGIFGIGQIPTGSKDPFALRRASLGILRIIIEKKLQLDLADLVKLAIEKHGKFDDNPKLSDAVIAYIIDRLRAGYEDRGISAEVFLSVNAKHLSAPLDIDQRINAVQAFNQMPEASALASANKRVSNILAKVNAPISQTVDPALLQEPAEIALAEQLTLQKTKVSPLFAVADYEGGLKALAALQPTVDAFFEHVMVNADEAALRSNRQALLKQLQDLFLQVADISLLVVGK